VETAAEDSATYRISIDAPPGHVLATLRDLTAYPDWQHEITAVEVLRSDDLGLPREAQLTFSSMGMKMNLRLSLEHDERTMRWSLVEGDFVTRNDAEYTVIEQESGRTELSLRQELSLKWQMPRSVTKHMIGRRVAATMEAVKKRAEETSRSATE
jgi:ribosome-associated toxin RatA of RatAB toxin-antitoxin module